MFCCNYTLLVVFLSRAIIFRVPLPLYQIDSLLPYSREDEGLSCRAVFLRDRLYVVYVRLKDDLIR